MKRKATCERHEEGEREREGERVREREKEEREGERKGKESDYNSHSHVQVPADLMTLASPSRYFLMDMIIDIIHVHTGSGKQTLCLRNAVDRPES